MKRRSFLSVLAVGSAFALMGCTVEPDPTPDYRYRLTVEVDTPDGLKTGSSVLEVQTNMGRSSMDPSGSVVLLKLRGEAAAVDLGDGRVLFALLRSKTEVDWAKHVMTLMVPGKGMKFQTRFDRMLARTEEITLPPTFPAKVMPNRPARPMLVTFGDLSDPTSVAEVDHDDLAASFGEGVTLKRITVQLTDDPVTSGIEERLGWFRARAKSGGGLIPMTKNARGRYEAAPGYDESLVDIGLSNFSTEAYKI